MKRTPLRRKTPLKRTTWMRVKAPSKPRKPISRLGVRGKQWEATRAELKREFAAAGITRCELGHPGCWRDNGLGFLHTRKRRNVSDLRRVVLGCNSCHAIEELLPESEMERRLEAVICAREFAFHHAAD